MLIYGCTRVASTIHAVTVYLKAAVWFEVPEPKRAHCTRTFTSTTHPPSPVRQMLAQRHARREAIEGSSRLLFQTHIQLLSCSACTSVVSVFC